MIPIRWHVGGSCPSDVLLRHKVTIDADLELVVFGQVEATEQQRGARHRLQVFIETKQVFAGGGRPASLEHQSRCLQCPRGCCALATETGHAIPRGVEDIVPITGRNTSGVAQLAQGKQMLRIEGRMPISTKVIVDRQALSSDGETRVGQGASVGLDDDGGHQGEARGRGRAVGASVAAPHDADLAAWV